MYSLYIQYDGFSWIKTKTYIKSFVGNSIAECKEVFLNIYEKDFSIISGLKIEDANGEVVFTKALK